MSSSDWVLLLSIKFAFIHMLWTAFQYNLRLFICIEMNLAFVAYVTYVDSSIYVYYIYLQRLIYRQIIIWSIATMNVIIVLTLDFQWWFILSFFDIISTTTQTFLLLISSFLSLLLTSCSLHKAWTIRYKCIAMTCQISCINILCNILN